MGKTKPKQATDDDIIVVIADPIDLTINDIMETADEIIKQRERIEKLERYRNTFSTNENGNYLLNMINILKTTLSEYIDSQIKGVPDGNSKEIIDEVIGQLTDDASKEKLREAKDQLRRMEESLADTTRESVGRKEEIKTLKSSLQAKESEIEHYKNSQPELESLRQIKVKYEDLQKGQFEQLNNKWTDLSKVFAVDETDKRKPKADKVKDKFAFAKDDKTPLTVEQIQANINTFELLQTANYFEIDNDVDAAQRPGKSDNQNAPLSSGQAALLNMKNNPAKF